MRRSTRSGIARSKAKARADIENLNAPDSMVLQGALPLKKERISPQLFNAKRDRYKASKRIDLALEVPKRTILPALQVTVSKVRRHILFLNVGDERILEAVRSLARNLDRPPWMRYLKGIVTRDGRLYLRENGKDVPFAFRDEKRNAVKRLYFDPKKPATIQPITDELRQSYCNISRTNVRNILRSLETYQLGFPRRLPPKIGNHTIYTKPGVIAADTFFKSNASKWKAINVLVIMDIWSRFSRAYALEKKEAPFFEVAFRSFFKEFTSLGHLPRRLLTDKGSELHVATKIIEKFRLPQDGQKPLHLRSFTGTPVQVVENMNSQFQRRLEPYAIAGIHDSVADLLWDISEQLNNQKRPRRSNFTPYQLLQMSDRDRRDVNQQYKNKDTFGIGVEAQNKLPFLKVGDHVRKLEMTFKEQAKGSKKGFEQKWSKTVFQVLRQTALRRNPLIKKYTIGGGGLPAQVTDVFSPRVTTDSQKSRQTSAHVSNVSRVWGG